MADRQALLLDFDGPICSVFAGHPATTVAAELRALLVDLGVDHPDYVKREQDPLGVLRWAGELGRPALARALDDELRAAELQAVHSALPTPHVRRVLEAARQAGIPAAIVSNNSTPAIDAYLIHHGLRSLIALTVGRAHGEPQRMKPNPEPILTAASGLGVAPAACVLVGDSTTDVEASRAAGVCSIGYANKPGKVERLERAGADAIVTSMADIATALLHHAGSS